MATTFDVLWPEGSNAPTSAAAYFTTRSTGVFTLEFVHSSLTGCFFKSMVPAGITIATMNLTIWMATHSATTGAVVWGVAIDNMTSHSVDTDSYGTQVVVGAATVNGTAAKPTSVTTTIGTANQQSLSVEQPFKLQIQRRALDAGDTCTDIVSLICVELTM